MSKSFEPHSSEENSGTQNPRSAWKQAAIRTCQIAMVLGKNIFRGVKATAKFAGDFYSRHEVATDVGALLVPSVIAYNTLAPSAYIPIMAGSVAACLLRYTDGNYADSDDKMSAVGLGAILGAAGMAGIAMMNDGRDKVLLSSVDEYLERNCFKPGKQTIAVLDRTFDVETLSINNKEPSLRIINDPSTPSENHTATFSIKFQNYGSWDGKPINMEQNYTTHARPGPWRPDRDMISIGGDVVELACGN